MQPGSSVGTQVDAALCLAHVASKTKFLHIASSFESAAGSSVLLVTALILFCADNINTMTPFLSYITEHAN